MAYRIAITVILIVLHYSCCIPVNKDDSKNPVKINFETASANDEPSEVYIDTTTIASVPCLSSQEQEETAARPDISSYRQDDAVLSLLVPRDSFSNEETDEILLPDRGPSIQYSQPSISPDWARSLYQVNPRNRLEAIDIGMSDFYGILYPQEHQKLFPAKNHGFSLNSLPPVYSTHIHGFHYPGENRKIADYDIDVLNPQNTVFLPTLVRPGRMLRSPEDDFLAELSHDAIMNNILPTMAVPFVRYAGSSMPYYGRSNGAAVALYPNVASGGCAQPILVSCSPKIIRGNLKQKPYSESIKFSSPGTPIAYRKQAEHTINNNNII